MRLLAALLIAAPLAAQTQTAPSAGAAVIAPAASGAASDAPRRAPAVLPARNPSTADPYWAIGQAELRARLGRAQGARAKNVILFVGDGMGVSTITAARIFAAQQAAKAAGGTALGEENQLSFERMPHAALVKTYNTDAQVPDSAGTASALNTGIKTRIGVLGILPGQSAADCANPAAFPRTLAELAKARGLGVGVVTTTRITHATPAAVFAHSPNRNWEGADRAYPAAQRAHAGACPDIAAQLVAFSPAGRGSGLDVALGGGRARFVPVAGGGARDDGRDLTAEWRARGGAYVTGRDGLMALDPRDRTSVLGLFADDHLPYHADRDALQEPTLAEMATFAVRKLQARGTGYYLMVEGGRIDHAHHATNPYRALDETVELANAVEAVRAMVGPDTLVLVTADHSHVFTIAGYPKRGADILGWITPVEGGESDGKVDANGALLDLAGKPMTILGYQNGPTEGKIGTNVLRRDVAPTDRNFLANKLHPLGSETHGGEDVALFAAGPGSAWVTGAIEQNTVFHVMARALGLVR